LSRTARREPGPRQEDKAAFGRQAQREQTAQSRDPNRVMLERSAVAPSKDGDASRDRELRP
jgi:hypothetical protein